MGLNSSIQGFISDASAKFGISSNYLSTTAQIESGGNPNAQASGSSASGLFQFTSGTAAQYGLSNPLDPQASTNAAAQLAANNYTSLQNAGISNPTDAQLYLAHQQGASGAAALINAAPGTLASSVVSSGAITGNGGTIGETAADFVSQWTNKFNAISGGASSSSPTGAAGSSSAAAASTGSASTLVGGLTDLVSSYFVRGGVLVLGLIFVAIGLSMFKALAPVTAPIKTAGKAAAVAVAA